MASCAKCGKHPLRKNKKGEFRCRRCGPRPIRSVGCAAPAAVLLGPRAPLAPGPITFWSPHRKLKVLNAIDQADADRRAALMAEHSLTPDEVDQWRTAYERHGFDGLKTRRQENRL